MLISVNLGGTHLHTLFFFPIACKRLKKLIDRLEAYLPILWYIGEGLLQATPLFHPFPIFEEQHGVLGF